MKKGVDKTPNKWYSILTEEQQTQYREERHE